MNWTGDPMIALTKPVWIVRYFDSCYGGGGLAMKTPGKKLYAITLIKINS